MNPSIPFEERKIALVLIAELNLLALASDHVYAEATSLIQNMVRSGRKNQSNRKRKQHLEVGSTSTQRRR